MGRLGRRVLANKLLSGLRLEHSTLLPRSGKYLSGPYIEKIRPCWLVLTNSCQGHIFKYQALLPRFVEPDRDGIGSSFECHTYPSSYSSDWML